MTETIFDMNKYDDWEGEFTATLYFIIILVNNDDLTFISIFV